MKEILTKFISKDIMRSKMSRVFISLSVLSLILSYINGTDYRLLIFELIIYIVLAMTANCMIYGNCKLSSAIVLLFPVSLVVVNILEMTGIKVDILRKMTEQTKTLDSSYLWKTDEEKKKYVTKLEHTLDEDIDEVTS